ncbi:MAG TPA: hypothetical protein VLK65_31245 [Vicinamibacteria bacterium]|nr:hypothetical protein [Vicinamibacteria bacterium]
MTRCIVIPTLAATVLALGCASPGAEPKAIFSSALNSVEDILTRDGVAVDREVSHDGQGAIRIEAEGDAATSTTVRLAEVEPKDAENVTLTYRAHLRSEGLTGKAYLEMWCSIPGKGEFFSRALDSPLTGSTEWVTQETPFFLDEGQRAQTVKLNLVIEGSGTVWVDDIVLVQAER